MNTDQKHDNRIRIQQLAGDVLDGLERVIARVAVDETARAPSIADMRRQGANMVEAWRFCARSACRRKRCCRGEPMHCLRLAVPRLPEGALEGLVGKRRRPRRSKRANVRPTAGGQR